MIMNTHKQEKPRKKTVSAGTVGYINACITLRLQGLNEAQRVRERVVIIRLKREPIIVTVIYE